MQHFDGARLSQNSVRNAVWHALNEPVCRYLRTRNPRCSTVYTDYSLGPLTRDSPCITSDFRTVPRLWTSGTQPPLCHTPYVIQRDKFVVLRWGKFLEVKLQAGNGVSQY